MDRDNIAMQPIEGDNMLVIERRYNGELCETLTPLPGESLLMCVTIAIGEFIPVRFNYDIDGEAARLVNFYNADPDNMAACQLPITLPDRNSATVTIVNTEKVSV